MSRHGVLVLSSHLLLLLCAPLISSHQTAPRHNHRRHPEVILGSPEDGNQTAPRHVERPSSHAVIAGGELYKPIPLRSISPVWTLQIVGQGDVTWRGFGTTLGWFANFVGGYDNPYHSRLMDLLYSPLKGMGLSIARYVIPGGFNPARHVTTASRLNLQTMQAFKASPFGRYDWSADRKQRAVLIGAVRRGAVADAVAYSPPWWMTRTKDSFASVGPNLEPAQYMAYANYVTDVLNWYRVRWNVTFEGLSPFNEPFQAITKESMFQEKCIFALGQVAPVLQSFRLQMVRRFLVGTKLAGVDDWLRDSVEAYTQDPRLAVLTGRINVHGYHASTPLDGDVLSQLRLVDKMRRAYHKDVWVSEWRPMNAPKGEFPRAVFMARQMVDMINTAGASAFIHRQAITPLPSGANPTPPDDGLIKLHFNYRMPLRPQLTASFHVQQMLSRAIRPGAKILHISPKNTRTFLVGYEAAARTLSIIVINELPSTVLLSITSLGSKVGLRNLVRQGVVAEIRRCTAKENNRLVTKGVLAPSLDKLKGIKIVGLGVTSIVLKGIVVVDPSAGPTTQPKVPAPATKGPASTKKDPVPAKKYLAHAKQHHAHVKKDPAPTTDPAYSNSPAPEPSSDSGSEAPLPAPSASAESPTWAPEPSTSEQPLTLTPGPSP